jgi:hypothetical protein
MFGSGDSSSASFAVSSEGRLFDSEVPGPQGRSPSFFSALNGTTEDVPFPACLTDSRFSVRNPVRFDHFLTQMAFRASRELQRTSNPHSWIPPRLGARLEVAPFPDLIDLSRMVGLAGVRREVQRPRDLQSRNPSRGVLSYFLGRDSGGTRPERR